MVRGLLGVSGGIGQAKVTRDRQRKVVGGAGRLVHDDVFQISRHAVVAGRQQRQHEIHHADIGADPDDQHGFQPVAGDPVQQAVGPVGLDGPDEAVDAVLADQGGVLGGA